MARILVVDDNNSVRDVLKMMLERSAHRVLGAPSAEHALELLKAQAVDLALIDIEMPGMNGYELCEHLRRDARWRTLPIAMMTGRAVTGVLEQVQAAGAQCLIAKPFARNELLTSIRDLLANPPVG